MQNQRASSLNEAYRRISEKFEPTRRSVGGNVFLNVFHKPADDAWLVSLNTLRDERVGVWDAYLRTTFSADTPHGVIEIRPGASSPALDALLTERRVADWAYVTAYNPGHDFSPRRRTSVRMESSANSWRAGAGSRSKVAAPAPLVAGHKR